MGAELPENIERLFDFIVLANNEDILNYVIHVMFSGNNNRVYSTQQKFLKSIQKLKPISLSAPKMLIKILKNGEYNGRKIDIRLELDISTALTIILKNNANFIREILNENLTSVNSRHVKEHILLENEVLLQILIKMNTCERFFERRQNEIDICLEAYLRALNNFQPVQINILTRRKIFELGYKIANPSNNYGNFSIMAAYLAIEWATKFL